MGVLGEEFGDETTGAVVLEEHFDGALESVDHAVPSFETGVGSGGWESDGCEFFIEEFIAFVEGERGSGGGRSGNGRGSGGMMKRERRGNGRGEMRKMRKRERRRNWKHGFVFWGKVGGFRERKG